MKSKRDGLHYVCAFADTLYRIFSTGVVSSSSIIIVSSSCLVLSALQHK